MRAALAAENAGRSIMHMEVGQPGTPAPRAAREAAMRALQGETLGYTMALGNDALRERIAQHYADWYGVRWSRAHRRDRRIVGGFVLAFLAVFDVGDAVALPSPGYPCYRHILSALGQRSVLIETGPATDWMPTADDVMRRAPRRHQRPSDRQPRQPDRHDDLARAAAACGRVQRARRAAHIR